MATPTELGFKESRVKPLLYFRYYGAKGTIYIDMNLNPPNIYAIKNAETITASDFMRFLRQRLSEGELEARNRRIKETQVKTLRDYERRWVSFFRLPKEEQRAIKLRERQLFDNFKNCNRCDETEDSTLLTPKAEIKP